MYLTSNLLDPVNILVNHFLRSLLVRFISTPLASCSGESMRNISKQLELALLFDTAAESFLKFRLQSFILGRHVIERDSNFSTLFASEGTSVY